MISASFSFERFEFFICLCRRFRGLSKPAFSLFIAAQNLRIQLVISRMSINDQQISHKLL